MPTRQSGLVQKGWGYEIIWATTENYCGKMLVFAKEGSTMSMHFHKEKDETWFVNAGKFKVRWINTEDACMYEKELVEGDTWHNAPLSPHQLIALMPNSMIIEVSTADSVEDNFRIAQGDSQTNGQTEQP